MRSKTLAVTALLLGLTLVGCDPGSSPNTAPVISAFTPSAAHVARGTSVDLTVTASDAQGDALTYAFSRGTCDGTLSVDEGTPQQASNVTFEAGNVVFGECRLDVTVADTHGNTAEGHATLIVDATRAFGVDSTASANVVGVSDDGAPGFGTGSIRATGTPKAELAFLPADLFGHAVTLGDVASVSYWTKKATTHADDHVQDWYLALYTAVYPAPTTGWYGARIGTEPYLARNLTETAGEWTRWSTDGETNQLRFFESTYGYFGSATDPTWTDFVAGSSLTGSHSADPVPYATQEIESFTVQTASSAAGFDGQLDGIRIELRDGAVAELDLQP
jgi:hypothetical protein